MHYDFKLTKITPHSAPSEPLQQVHRATFFNIVIPQRAAKIKLSAIAYESHKVRILIPQQANTFFEMVYTLIQRGHFDSECSARSCFDDNLNGTAHGG